MANKKLLLVNVKEKNKVRSTTVTVYNEAHDILRELSSRTGLSITMIANKMIKFAADYVEIDGDESDEED